MDLSQAFYGNVDGMTFIGWSDGMLHNSSFTFCDAVAPSPAICGCICDPAYPFQ
jgi:hypothetical protein